MNLAQAKAIVYGPEPTSAAQLEAARQVLSPESSFANRRLAKVQCDAAVKEAYRAEIQFTRIEFDGGRIFAATAYKSGVMLPRRA